MPTRLKVETALPELPEVETIRQGLAKRVVNHRIEQVLGTGSRLVRNNPQGMADLHAHLGGARVAAVSRRGKFMWMEFEESDFALVIHLGMSGQVRVRRRLPAEPGRHEHVRLLLDDGTAVSFVDPRTFGHLTISRLHEDVTGRHVPETMRAVAPDPFEDVPREIFTSALAKTRRHVKTALLDQSVVSGIGNIYADEALFRARFHGTVRSADLAQEDAATVIDAARLVMGRALQVGGTSFDALYVDTEGNPGYFERSLRVYGRVGRPCRDCGTTIAREVVGGRSHFFCPQCQPVPRDIGA